MILATLCFGIMDGVSRYLAEEYNVFIINMYRIWLLVLFVLIYSIKKGGIKQISSSKKPIIQIIRGILLISCVCIGVYSFTVLGLVAAHTIIAIYPLLVLPLSYYFLNEKIGWRRWCAVFVGFLGIIIILNPISMSFNFNMVWPLLLAFLLAIYSILTRNISAYDNSETSFFLGGYCRWNSNDYNRSVFFRIINFKRYSLVFITLFFKYLWTFFIYKST